MQPIKRHFFLTVYDGAIDIARQYMPESFRREVAEENWHKVYPIMRNISSSIEIPIRLKYEFHYR